MALGVNRACQQEVSAQLAHDSCTLGIIDWFKQWLWCVYTTKESVHVFWGLTRYSYYIDEHREISGILILDVTVRFHCVLQKCCFKELWKTRGKESHVCVCALAVYLIAPVNCACNSQISGSPFVFSQLHQTLLQQAKPSIISLQTMCLDTLPCRHIDGHFLCIPRAERIDSTSIRVWTAGEPSHHSLASQTDSQYSQAWKAGQYWATG